MKNTFLYLILIASLLLNGYLAFLSRTGEARGAFAVDAHREQNAGLRRDTGRVPDAHNTPSPVEGESAADARNSKPVASTVVIPVSALRHLRVSLLDQNYRLTSAFQEIAALSPSQEERLNDAVKIAVQRLVGLQALNTEVSALSENQTRLHYSPDLVEAEGISRELTRQAAAILDTETMSLFRELAMTELDKRLNSFGKADVTYTITRRIAPNGGVVFDVSGSEAFISDPEKARVQVLNTYTKHELLARIPGASKIPGIN